VSTGGGGGCGSNETASGAVTNFVCGSASDPASPNPTNATAASLVAACLSLGHSVRMSGGGGGGGGASGCCSESVGYGFSFAARYDPPGSSRRLKGGGEGEHYKYDVVGKALKDASAGCEGGFQDWCCTCSGAKAALSASPPNASSGVNWLEHADCCGEGSSASPSPPNPPNLPSQTETTRYVFKDLLVDPANVRGGRCDLFSSDSQCPLGDEGLALTNCPGEWLAPPPLLAAPAPPAGAEPEPAMSAGAAFAVAGVAGFGLVAATYATYERARAEREEPSPVLPRDLHGGGYLGVLGGEGGGRGEPTETTGLLMRTMQEPAYTA
jgi:hypothetical protein